MIAVRLSFRYEVLPVRDTCSNSRIGTSHIDASSARLLYQIEILIPVRKLMPVSFKRSMTVRFTFSFNFNYFLPKENSRRHKNGLRERDRKFSSLSGMNVVPISIKHALSVLSLTSDLAAGLLYYGGKQYW